MNKAGLFFLHAAAAAAAIACVATVIFALEHTMPDVAWAETRPLPPPPPNPVRIVWRSTRQPFDKLSAATRAIYDREAALNPGWVLRYLDDDAAAAEIRMCAPKAVSDAFHALDCGAFRADLLRYSLLAAHGGLWLDGCSEVVVPYESLLFGDVTVAHDLQGPLQIAMNGGAPALQICFLAAAAAGDPLLIAARDAAAANVNARAYTGNRLGITGPGLFGRVFAAAGSPARVSTPLVDTGLGYLVDARSRQRVVKRKTGGYVEDVKHKILSVANSPRDYTVQWVFSSVYRDRRGWNWAVTGLACAVLAGAAAIHAAGAASSRRGMNLIFAAAAALLIITLRFALWTPSI